MNESAVGGEIISESDMSSDDDIEKQNCVMRCIESISVQSTEMYKLKYFITAILVAGVVASKGIAGIILIDIVEVLFFVIEMIWWREDKYNWKLRILDFVLTLLAYNTACLVTNNTPALHALIIISVYGILLIKSYYVITAFIEKRREEAEVKPEEKVEPVMQVGEEIPEKKANPNIISIESSIDQARP
jgi:hypothetical protein